MIIIDEHADSALIKRLEELRSQPKAAQLIHFKLSGRLTESGSAEHARSNVIASVQNFISGISPQMYICADGDIFILAPSLAAKEARKIIYDVALRLHATAASDFAELYEVEAHANKLLLLVEQKVEERRKAAEALQKQQQMEQAARKHQEILNHGVSHHKTHDIAARRRSRSKPELMIIEDDTFSCKLVESVLQKQYPFTALSSPEQAIPTYAHKAPDVLFLDINLPDVTGHELLEKIIALDPNAYVIMLSSYSDRANITQAMKSGAKGFITKPFTRDKLFQYIDRCPTIRQNEGK